MLHVFGLRLFLAEIGAIAFTRADVASDAKRYINQLLCDDRLEPLLPHERDGISTMGYDGLAVFEADSDELKELRAHLREQRIRAAEARYPIQASDLLSEMRKNVDGFYRRLNWNDAEQGYLARIPVLREITPTDFVTAFLELHPDDQRTVLLSLRGRYERGSLANELSSEKPWLIEVRHRLEEAAAAMKPYPRWRISGQVQSAFSQILAEEKNAS